MAGLIFVLVAVLASTSATARIATYTESVSTGDNIALGFPVPQPVDTPDAFDGFRSHAGLRNRLDALALASPALARHSLGSSRAARDIPVYVFGDSALGQAPAILQIGGVHAREWASPEAVTRIAENLVAGLSSTGLERYLADHVLIALAPIINPDGFVATQQEPTRTRIDEDPENSANDPEYPRDGRQRRKNLLDTDGDLATAGDSLQGVDLNRNIGRFWATSDASSSDPRSILYHGSAEASEPETRAVKQAASLLGTDRLRLFIDTHSFGRVYFYNNTGAVRLRNLTRALADNMSRVAVQDYTPVQEPTLSGIGANDEYFAYELQIPSYTLEIEPGLELQAAEYGGRPNVSHSGFILPEAEITRVSAEVFAMALLGYYHQAGPPILQRVEIRDADDALVYAGEWQDQGATRTLSVDRSRPLTPDAEYRLNLQFDKPMRWPDGNNAGQYPGQNVTLAPIVELLGEGNRSQELGNQGQWQTSQYRFDTYTLTFRPDRQLGPSPRLGVSVRDLSGLALDADPGTPAGWADGHWTRYEDSTGNTGDTGGEDASHTLTQTAPASGSGGGGSGSLHWWLLALLAAWRRKLA